MLVVMSGEPSVDRDVPIERIELDDTAWVDVARGWLTNAGALHEHLLAEVPWQTSRLYRYDHEVEERRLGSSCKRGTPLPHPALAEATRVLRHRYGVEFPGFGMIQYRDGNDGQAFHRDTDMRWLDDTIIAILSLGAQAGVGPRISVQWRFARRVGRPFQGASYRAPLHYSRERP